MEVSVEKIDTELIGKNILTITNVDESDSYSLFEKKFIETYNPCYVSARINASDLDKINYLIRHGFEPAEIQLRLRKKIQRAKDLTKLPYYYVEVDNLIEMQEIAQIASIIFNKDRFSQDKYFNKDFSGQRYKKFIEKSYRNQDEFLYKMSHKETGKIVAFGTHKRFEDKTALILLGGVVQEYIGFGLGAVHDYFAQNELLKSGINKIYTHVSAINKPILDLQISGLGYKIDKTFLILRKVF